MTEENRPQDFEEKEPDTSTDDEVLPAASAALPPPPPAEAVAEPPSPTDVRVVPPRSHPELGWLLFGCVAAFVACCTPWERMPVFPGTTYGFQMITGAFLLAFAGYAILVGVLNMLQGRMRVGSSFVTMFFALYFGIRKLTDTLRAPGWQSWSSFKTGSLQARVSAFLGQIAPGVWLALLGGVVILLVFLRAMVPAKSAATPAPSPSSRRRRR